MAKNSEFLGILLHRLEIAKKFGSKFSRQASQARLDYEISSVEDALSKLNSDDLKNWIQVPYIFSTVESLKSAVFDTMPTIYIQRGGKKDEEFSDFVNLLWQYTERKTKIIRILKDDVLPAFLVTGMAFVAVNWLTETQDVPDKVVDVVRDTEGNVIVDENGNEVTQEFNVTRTIITKNQPVVEYISNDRIYFSPESTFTAFDADNTKIPYVIIEYRYDKDTAEYIYGKKLEPTGKLFVSVGDKNSVLDTSRVISNESEVDKDDDRVVIYRYFGALPKDVVKDEFAPFSCFTLDFYEKGILTEPKRVRNKPVFILGNYGMPENFWKFGEAKVLRNLEQDVSFGRSIIADYRGKMATKLAVPFGTEVDEEALRSGRFCVVNYAGNNPPSYITPPPIPSAVYDAIAQSREDIQMVSGQLDISRGGTQSVVQTATGQKIFNAVHERRSKFKADRISELLADMAQYILSLYAEKLTVEELAEITDYDVEYIKSNNFIEKMSKIGLVYDVYIDAELSSENREVRASQAIAMFRELSQSPYVNQEELVRQVIKIGFGQKDVDRFLSMEINPEKMLGVVDTLGELGIIPQELMPEIIQKIQMLSSGAIPSGQSSGGGRPQVRSTEEVVEDQLPAADALQQEAQINAAYKQIGQLRTNYGQKGQV